MSSASHVIILCYIDIDIDIDVYCSHPQYTRGYYGRSYNDKTYDGTKHRDNSDMRHSKHTHNIRMHGHIHTPGGWQRLRSHHHAGMLGGAEQTHVLAAASALAGARADGS